MIENNANLQNQIEAITALDNIISGNLFGDNRISDDDEYHLIIRELFDYNPSSSNNEMQFHVILLPCTKAWISVISVEIRNECATRSGPQGIRRNF